MDGSKQSEANPTRCDAGPTPAATSTSTVTAGDSTAEVTAPLHSPPLTAEEAGAATQSQPSNPQPEPEPASEPMVETTDGSNAAANDELPHVRRRRRRHSASIQSQQSTDNDQSNTTPESPVERTEADTDANADATTDSQSQTSRGVKRSRKRIALARDGAGGSEPTNEAASDTNDDDGTGPAASSKARDTRFVDKSLKKGSSLLIFSKVGYRRMLKHSFNKQ